MPTARTVLSPASCEHGQPSPPAALLQLTSPSRTAHTHAHMEVHIPTPRVLIQTPHTVSSGTSKVAGWTARAMGLSLPF